MSGEPVGTPTGPCPERCARAGTRTGEGRMSLPSGHGPVPVTGATAAAAWWLGDAASRVLAGPFRSRVDAALAELSSGGDHGDLVPAHGIRREDGSLAPRFSADDR